MGEDGGAALYLFSLNDALGNTDPIGKVVYIVMPKPGPQPKNPVDLDPWTGVREMRKTIVPGWNAGIKAWVQKIPDLLKKKEEQYGDVLYYWAIRVHKKKDYDWGEPIGKKEFLKRVMTEKVEIVDAPFTALKDDIKVIKATIAKAKNPWDYVAYFHDTTPHNKVLYAKGAVDRDTVKNEVYKAFAGNPKRVYASCVGDAQTGVFAYFMRILLEGGFPAKPIVEKPNEMETICHYAWYAAWIQYQVQSVDLKWNPTYEDLLPWINP